MICGGVVRSRIDQQLPACATAVTSMLIPTGLPTVTNDDTAAIAHGEECVTTEGTITRHALDKLS